MQEGKGIRDISNVLRGGRKKDGRSFKHNDKVNSREGYDVMFSEHGEPDWRRISGENIRVSE